MNKERSTYTLSPLYTAHYTRAIVDTVTECLCLRAEALPLLFFIHVAAA